MIQVSKEEAMLRARPLTPHEIERLKVLVTDKRVSMRTLQRAYIIWRSSQGIHVPAIAQELGLDDSTVRLWIKRFNREGFAGLGDRPRSGAKKKYSDALVATICEVARTVPGALDLPFACWTLNRLQDYLRSRSIAVGRSQLHNILRKNHIDWRYKIEKLESHARERAMLSLGSAIIILGIIPYGLAGC
jgi:transposase